jgi:galactosylxylosylprotein 3-beta-galactosyltransferase
MLRLVVMAASLVAEGSSAAVLTQRAEALSAASMSLSADPIRPLDLAIIVPSSAANAAQRQMLRDTWLRWQHSLPGVRIATRFLVGRRDAGAEALRRVASEHERHGDLLQLDVSDDYRNLTAKTAGGLVWAGDEALGARHVLKTDDNAFVRLDLLLDELRAAPATRFYWGNFRADEPTHNPNSRWYDSNWTMCDTTVPYAFGGGYVLSGDLARYVRTNAPLLRHWVSEDLSVGAWLAPLDVETRHDLRFDTATVSRGCRSIWLVTKKQSPAMMQAKWDRLNGGLPMCSPDQDFEELSDESGMRRVDFSKPPSKAFTNGPTDEYKAEVIQEGNVKVGHPVFAP